MFNEVDRVMGLVKEHLLYRPAMEPIDLYKLLYQGVRGPEHILTDPEAFKERLVEEWDGLDPANGDPLWESIRPDGSLLRLNLRPFKAAGGRLDELATGCLEAGRCSWGTPAELKLTWDLMTTAIREDSLSGLVLADIVAFTAWLEEKVFPPVHHSERYRKLYRPAYRLVTAEFREQQK